MSIPRRPLHVRSEDEHQAVERTAGARRLPIEAAVVGDDQAVADVHQEQPQPPRRRPLGHGPTVADSPSPTGSDAPTSGR
ncbi:hypothetical protein ACH4E7_43725 [Kitasatospora sp. NPDC018058]|uniref:hypothetical protein n=1 Tax=Kitasatospora sp. NPDC018058 TaxID=3364025 RepID=UPI0037BEADB5